MILLILKNNDEKKILNIKCLYTHPRSNTQSALDKTFVLAEKLLHSGSEFIYCQNNGEI
jgi:hypothetical protein